MRDLERKVELVAGSHLPVLIEGESGTGKETLAEYLHRRSRPDGALLRLHCGREEDEEAARELFRRPGGGDGKLAGTPPGSLFLKNVHLLSRRMQHRLLAVLGDGLGLDGHGNGDAPSVRLICSAAESLEQRVAGGEFAPDLYFRLAVCRLTVPPLRLRLEEVPHLFLAMIERFGSGNGVPVPAPTSELQQALCSYSWPGNLRELENVARSYAVTPDPQQLKTELQRRSRTLLVTSKVDDDDLSLREQVRRAARQLESEIILKALDRHRWNRRRAAQTLRISYRALLYKMKDCNLRTETVRATK